MLVHLPGTFQMTAAGSKLHQKKRSINHTTKAEQSKNKMHEGFKQTLTSGGANER